ncbi:MAG: thiamine phosphate synthase [Pseudomonadota bacterium]
MSAVFNYSFYLITDSQLCYPKRLLEVVKVAVENGVDCVQYREKQQPFHIRREQAEQLKQLLDRYRVPLIINDDVKLAQQVDATGVHLGQTDMSVTQARELLGTEKIIGLSIENLDQARAAADLDVNYYGVGPVFATTTKLNAAPAIGVEKLLLIKNILPKPIIAIGGIAANDVKKVLRIADGIAVVSAVMAASNIAQATQQLKYELTR